MLKKSLPAAWTAQKEDDPPSAATDVTRIEGGHPDVLYFVTQPSQRANYLAVRLRQFAGWHVVVDGVTQVVHAQRDDGLLAIPLAAGASHSVEVYYVWTWDEWLGLILSIVSAVAVLLYCIQRGRTKTVPARP